MSTHGKFIFTNEELMNSPSRKHGYDPDREFYSRQHAANLIQDMGQHLQLTLLCINTAIVYMHRFYVFHSLAIFHRNSIAVSALFLAAKVEDQPRKLEQVIKAAHVCLCKDGTKLDITSKQYLTQVEDLLFNENIMLQTLGFELRIDHPHPYVLQCCTAVNVGKEIAQNAYLLSTYCWHLTMMCLQYSPKIIACTCIYITCKCSNFEISRLNDGRNWFQYLDNDITLETIQKLAQEFLDILKKCPNKFRNKTLFLNKGKQPLKVPSALISHSLTKVLEEKPASQESKTLEEFLHPFFVNTQQEEIYSKTETLNNYQYYSFSNNDAKAMVMPSHNVPSEIFNNYKPPQVDFQINYSQPGSSEGGGKRKYEMMANPNLAFHNGPMIHHNVIPNNLDYLNCLQINQSEILHEDPLGLYVLNSANDPKRFKYY